MPQNIIIERKRKEYAKNDVEDLIKQENIDYDEYYNWMDLKLFYDKQMDDYNAREQIYFVKQKKIVIKGKAFIKQGVWKKFTLEDYCEQKDQFFIKFEENGCYEYFDRIYLYFECENPKKFIQRLSGAFQQRIKSDSLIRYNYIIDNMPLQDLQELNPYQIKKIKDLVQIKQLQNMQIASLLVEINKDFCRTMNKMIFDLHLKNNFVQQQDFFIVKNLNNLKFIYNQSQNKAQMFGHISINRGDTIIIQNNQKVEIEEYKGFRKLFKDFCIDSLHMKIEVVKSLQQIKDECLKLSQVNVFNTKFQGPFVLQELRYIQESANSKLMHYINDVWVSNVEKIINQNFEKVGKGWYNLKESNSQTYNFSKLKRFLTLVKLIMQDSIYSLIYENFNILEQYIINYIPKQTQVINLQNVINIYRTEKQQKALFIIDIVKSQTEEEYLYAINPDTYIQNILNFFEKTLQNIKTIPDIESIIMTQLYTSLSSKTYLKTIQKPKEKPFKYGQESKYKNFNQEGTWIWNLLDNLKEKLEEGIQPLKLYLSKFEEFNEIMKLNTEEYINKIKKQGIECEIIKIQTEIEKVKKQNKNIFKLIYTKDILIRRENKKSNPIINKSILFLNLFKGSVKLFSRKIQYIEKQINEPNSSSRKRKYIKNIQLVPCDIIKPINPSKRYFPIIRNARIYLKIAFPS
ncbi:hypothetical protein IMG5_184900 [Ichthyophthirius multifiliis]|uniref:Uncharacterized protein n=1 Tax=Ichthyophthirius multifiliis TaxID=5932 RepID=G0R3E6_ICHMU|nr:hypothetical protein IMG5_184900 [Ichthyophthirius multifiliis]EGR28020.1 hypothetical protein IMG5_184900 [Ichthyophthirius multifiliis]|eukprot:XP_004027365.1 hypothetical protein IMG5_184900 [Ichthyophthirius multifiliis]